MKKLLFSLLLSGHLFAQSYYTLDNVQNLNLYFASETDFLTQEQEDSIKQSVTQKLEKAGFVFGKTDAYIFVVRVESIEIEGSQAINIQIKLGEEVITKRKDDIETFAYTYLESKLIEGFSPYQDTVETLNGMVDKFVASHKDDNEE